MKIIIPEVEFSIGENLYLRIENVSFLPATQGRYSGAPEDCYEAEPAECDWLEHNASLVLVKRVMKKMNYADIMTGKKPEYEIVRKDFPVDDTFVYEYYDQIIEAIEEMKNEN
jgi:hypothetical protein